MNYLIPPIIDIVVPIIVATNGCPGKNCNFCLRCMEYHPES